MRILRNTLLLLLAALMLSGCWGGSRWYQKLTVEVDAPDGMKTASSVSRVTAAMNNFVPGFPGGNLQTGLRGEAVVIEVLPGRYLFALIDKLTFLAPEVFAEELGLDKPPGSRPDFEEWAEELSRLRGTRTVPEELYPLLVTFTDINDPKTVKRVDPNDLAAAFCPSAPASPSVAGQDLATSQSASPRTGGAADAASKTKPCVRLKRITLSITDEPVTKGRVEEVLGWINNLEQYRKDPDNPFTSTLPREIGGLRSG